MLYTELDTAHEFGLDPWVYFMRAREERTTMVAFIYAKRALQIMSDYDNRPKSKKSNR